MQVENIFPNPKAILSKKVGDLPNVKSKAEEKHGQISNWYVSEVKSVKELFSNEVDFNEDLSRWDVGKVRNMYWMFRGANSFNYDIGGMEREQVDEHGENVCAF